LSNTARRARERLDHITKRLSDPRRLIRERWQTRDHLEERLVRAMEARHKAAINRLALLSARLHALSPAASLQRGYAIVRQKATATVLHSYSEVAVGSLVEILLADGTVDATVDGAHPREDNA
jgi:exodeoxyribonuclease VII large subunit